MRRRRLLAILLSATASACANATGTLSPTAPTPTPSPSQPANSWIVSQIGDIVQAAYGSGTSYPQYVAFHSASGYLRLVYGPSSGWGTSVIVLPSLWAQGSYYQGAPTVTSWHSENGDLVIAFTATIAGLAVTGQIRVVPPAQDSISATVTVNVSGSVALDPRPAEAFKPVMLSSMHVSSSAFDTQAAFVDDRAVPISAAGWILQAPVSTAVWGLQGGSSSWKPSAPTVEITMDRALPVTGWVTPSSDPNDDNVGFWSASDRVLTSWQYKVRVHKQ